MTKLITYDIIYAFMIARVLKEKIKSLPDKFGVYFFRLKNGKNIYIGKAVSLKSRISGYLKTEDARITKMVQAANKLEFKITESDIEALILESQYIKKYRPMFNIVMRDDKQYFYVAFTKEKFPRIFLTHQPFKTKNEKLKTKNYIGPFTDGGALKSTLKYLRNVFPYCTCKQKHHNRCLNYHIGKCLGFCCLKNHKPSKQELDKYLSNIKALKDILSGNKISLIKKLEKEMTTKAKEEEFEEAIEIRSKLERLQRIFQNAQIIKEIKKTENTLVDLRNALELEKIPYRIEAYDISNIQGQNATGSMVVFENGKPNKNEYRKFKIRTVNQASDTDMLKEVLSRRLNHMEWSYPDLVVIDGGKGQLNAARAAISKQIPIIALTKDKKHRGEKITTSKQVVLLSTLKNNVKNLLLSIDSEAHRFAIDYYRKLHRKAIM